MSRSWMVFAYGLAAGGLMTAIAFGVIFDAARRVRGGDCRSYRHDHRTGLCRCGHGFEEAHQGGQGWGCVMCAPETAKVVMVIEEPSREMQQQD